MIAVMNPLAERAEQIAAHLVGGYLGSAAQSEGPNSAIDFTFSTAAGGRVALEVTLITDPASAAWQGMAMRDGWRWPAKGAWQFRPRRGSFSYRITRDAAVRVAAACDQAGASSIDGLSEIDAATAEALALVTRAGDLYEGLRPGGIDLNQAVWADFPEATSPSFTDTVESWLRLPHIASHIAKTRDAPDVDQRHLFVVPVEEVLSSRFLTDDFEAPSRAPRGYEGIDALWVWSRFWHRSLICDAAGWRWQPFPQDENEDGSRADGT
ncbi:hypothetical protein OVA14_10410 [Agrococcus sp. SL85]|uniref:hypothetical protein n=1 Tax=Agrococcus sp. SL85 TaxID=2995141 RepID=UPI00226D270F|nr:hypothetical protein [Agrococcus sp. SL85]WAC65732.1 hypothetical protein OVA14_10410 [Agrococcus sp. SL85]